MKKILLFTIVTFCISQVIYAQGTNVASYFRSQASTISSLSENKDEVAIQNIVSTMESGWNEKNGEKYASVFADTHDFIVWNGYYFPNNTKSGNAQAHQSLYDGPFKTMDIHLIIDKIKLIREDIALVHVLGVAYKKGQAVPTDPGVIMTLLIEKKDTKWQILSFHNLDLEAFENEVTAAQSPIPLNVMYANWYKLNDTK